MLKNSIDVEGVRKVMKFKPMYFFIISVCSLSLTSCVKDIEKAGPETKFFVEKNKSCYLAKARATASSALSCDASKIDISVLTHERKKVVIKGLSYSNVEQIQSISAKGCGKSLNLHVFCEFEMNYIDRYDPNKCGSFVSSVWAKTVTVNFLSSLNRLSK